MKIAIVSLNGMPCNGETYFAIDLCKGINRIGHSCTLVSLNYRGCRNKSDVDEKDITYMKYKNMNILNGFDFVLFNSGKFKSDYLNIDFSGLAVKKGLCIHNCSSIKTYNLNSLYDKTHFDLLFSNDISTSKFKEKQAYVLNLPFDTNKPKAIHIDRNRIIIPTRFTFCKYIEDVAKLLKELKLSQTSYFYGKDGFYFNVIKDEFDDSFNYEFSPPFKSDVEKAEIVYKNALLALDGSNFKIKGNRVQIVQLECFHHEVVPCMKRVWFYDSFKERINGIAFEDQEGIKKTITDESFRNEIINNNKVLLNEYKCEKVAEDLINILKKETNHVGN